MANRKGSGSSPPLFSTTAAPPWIRQLLAEDFAATCKAERFCVPCAAAFCDHCCAGHHRGQGHEVVVRAAAAASGATRDSFCLDCAAGFSAALCAHHAGHETVRVVDCEGRHCVRCTSSEPWFPYFDGIETYVDEQGHKLTPIEPRCGARCAHCGRAVCFL
ncbi:hypothetical protein EJB05_06549, partial [Eragrostis curvula]